METNIAGYWKTNHFLYRQWERGVTDEELKVVLEKVTPVNGQQLLVVSRRLLRRILHKKTFELFIKMDDHTLITCFYCDFQDYLNARKKENYYIVS